MLLLHCRNRGKYLERHPMNPEKPAVHFTEEVTASRGNDAIVRFLTSPP